ncbi:unnamed protein product [Adineta steineri]|uniref:Uncharacterized protein n=1 Tax=Adineta steineri TaxID=433720 RepID=A0A814V3Z3_9BILA|nr:unnamed protein product [Adineta steineri]CAF1579909.1 unnamed protein product [Adineta steineri]
MDLEPSMNTSQDENIYSDYDNRPIRPMDQDALNEALARLPILVDEEDSTDTSEINNSIKIRRQPILAHSTRRKDFSGVNISQSILNTTGTPINNKRKIGGCTPLNKFSKQIDSDQDFIQMREENKVLEESKANLQLECILLKKSHENELEILKQEHQQIVDKLIQEHNSQCQQYNTSLLDKEQLLAQTNLELDNLRNDHTMLLLEKETFDKIVIEYELMKQEMNNKLIENDLTIKNLREEIENIPKIQKQKQLTTKSTNSRMPSSDRSRMINNNTFSKSNTNISTIRRPTGPLTSLPTTSNKSTSLLKSKLKGNVVIDDKKKSISNDKHFNSTSTRMK